MIVLVYILFTMCILKDRYTHASCASNTHVLKFGPTCKYMCHCQDETEQCGDEDGTCTSGCSDAWMGPGCQYRDVAFKQFTSHKDNTAPPEYSELAADGKLETCSRTNTNTHKPWWTFWLPQKELITGLVLITDPKVLDNFESYKVTVEGATTKAMGKYLYTNQKTCYGTSGWKHPNHIINVTCNQPLLNNQVRITLDGTSTQLVICDIRVYGGKNLAFGRQTNQSSFESIRPNSILTVDGVIGTVQNDCSSSMPEHGQAWWSVDLNYRMNIQAVHISTYIDDGLLNFHLQARNDSIVDWVTIHNDTGNIPPTKQITILTQARYLRLYTPEQSVNLTLCEVQVFGECISGRWGRGCDSLCGNCFNETPCSVQIGHCPQGCKDGYEDTSTCETACSDGKYGSNCTQTCGNCNDGVACLKNNGSCPSGCAERWRGDTCKEKCASGLFGDKCSQNCSDHCKGGIDNCNNVNGTCEKLCEVGWMGQMCDQECKNGSFGDTCLQLCGHCLHGPCDRVSGNCTGGCTVGYKLTTHCVDECSDGTYGINCLGTCGNCNGGIANCEKLTGACELGCAEGFVGYGCIKASSSPQAAIVGGVSAAAAVVAAVVVIMLILRRRRQKMSHTQSNENQLDALPSVSYNTDSPANKYDALQVVHGEVNPYDTLDTTEADTDVYEAMEP